MSDNNINTISYSFKNYINSFKSNSKNNGQYISINHSFFELMFGRGWQKLKPNMCFSVFPIAGYSTHLLNF